jgi:hypothetical protein
VDQDKLEFLEERAEEVAPDTTPDTVEVAEEPKEPKGEKPAEAIEPEPAPSAPPAPEPEAQRIPLTAMLDEREKRQNAERELQEMKRQLALIQQQKEQPAPPDFYEKPDERLAYETNRFKAELHNMKITQSRFLAEKDHGKELVDEAFGFFDQPQNRFLTAQFADHPSPYHAAVEFYKKQKFLNEVNDPDQWRNAERERIRQELMAEISQPSRPKAPPPSLGKAPAVGGTDTIAPGNTFDGMFPG